MAKAENNRGDGEEAARAKVSLIEARYREALVSAKRIGEGDAKGAKKRIEMFRSSFDDLADFLEFMRTEQPNRMDRIYMHVHVMISATIMLGQASAVLDEAKLYLDRLQSGRARAGHSDKAGERRLKLQGVVSAVLKSRGRKMSISKECADEIRPDICRALGKEAEESGYPGVGAIKKAISELKKRGTA